MSIAHSKGDKKGQGKEGWQLLSSKKSPKQAKRISSPSFNHDATLTGESNNIHMNGNTKPQEPLFLQRRRSGSREQPRMATHIHAKSWSGSMACGKKENPNHLNAYHRVWMTDAGRTGRPLFNDNINEEKDFGACTRRWNRARKKEHYDCYEKELNALKPHDEKFAIGANAKFWTHLQNKGANHGGQDKLMTVPLRSTGLHLKAGIYIGKYANVEHAQLMLKTGRKNKQNQPDEWMVDTRAPFDNRLHDDVVKQIDADDKLNSQISFDLFRPSTTRSCPQMGVDYMHR